MKTATSLTLIAAGAITAFAITAHIAFLNLQVTGWVLILSGAAGAIITRSSRLHRTPAVNNHPAAAATSTSQRPPPPRTAPGRQPTPAPNPTQEQHDTTKEYVDA